MQDGKYKVLVLSDHALSTSGVGTQTRHLINGLLKKGCWSFRQLGAAMKHENYEVVVVNPDFIIKPVDGFGSKEMIRVILATEQPDICFIFTDPRFFVWLFQIEDEVHQVCPIVWWHVWDNAPYPYFNDVYYESTDRINCHSYHTYSQLVEKHPEKTHFISHTVPKEIFFPLSDSEKKRYKMTTMGPERVDHFTGFWINRNARRKRPGDLLWAWKLFIERLEKEEGHRNASLILHTDPLDPEGPNLFSVAENLLIKDTIVFSTQRCDFQQINVMHNIADFTINVSYAEGFGLSTLEAMQTGTPIIAPLTGGQTRQVIDYRDGTENGFALPIEMQTLAGSQHVPYIYEDFTSVETIADKIWKMYSLGSEGRKKLGVKCLDYVDHQFDYEEMVEKWHQSMIEVIHEWRENRCGRKSYEILEVE